MLSAALYLYLTARFFVVAAMYGTTVAVLQDLYFVIATNGGSAVSACVRMLACHPEHNEGRSNQHFI